MIHAEHLLNSPEPYHYDDVAGGTTAKPYPLRKARNTESKSRQPDTRGWIKHHVIARAALEHVGAVEGLVRHSAGLNRRVVLPVIVESDEELRPFGAVDQRRLRGMRRAEDQARARDEQAGRERTL